MNFRFNLIASRDAAKSICHSIDSIDSVSRGVLIKFILCFT